VDLEGVEFPTSLVWVSKRLTRNVVTLAAAVRRPGARVAEVKVGIDGLLPGAPFLEISAKPHDASSVEDYAVKATKLVRRSTGTLAMPDDYIRMTLDFHIATFNVPFAWREGTTQRVASLFANEYVPGIGRVFVALFGSPHSILASMAEESYTGRTPSDADGLYRILHDTREPEDVQLRQATLDDPAEAAYSDLERADLAAQVICCLRDPLPARPLDVLAKADVVVRGHTLDYATSLGIPHDLIIIGAALWAGTPARRPDPLVISSAPAGDVRLWPVFETALFEFLCERRSGGRPVVPPEVLGSETWCAYASWFVNLGHRLGQPVSEMMALRWPGRLDPRRYLSRGWRDSYNPRPIGRTGYALRVGQTRFVLVTATGEAFPVRQPDCVYWPDESHRWLESRKKPDTVATNLMRTVRLAMWEQATDWRGRVTG
jgi:hypothetical protein